MAVSLVELTCLDLIRYAHAVGDFDAVATVLADLGDKIDGEKLAAIAPYFERATIQRLWLPAGSPWTSGGGRTSPPPAIRAILRSVGEARSRTPQGQDRVHGGRARREKRSVARRGATPAGDRRMIPVQNIIA
jgi:hypothetical protein